MVHVSNGNLMPIFIELWQLSTLLYNVIRPKPGVNIA